jgi:heme-degrading monooxygenase HmoA
LPGSFYIEEETCPMSDFAQTPWKNNASHMKAKEMGKKLWYEQYKIRICKVERDGLFH